MQTRYVAIVTLALIVGVFIVAPPLYFRYGSGLYQGVDFFRADVEPYYLSSIQEVYDGHYFLGNIYSTDGKDKPSLTRQLLSTWIVAGLGKILKISAADINLLTKFLFPFLLFLLVYALFYELTQEWLYALLAAVFIMLAPATLEFFNPASWWGIVTRGDFLASNYQFLSYSRPINPQVSSFFFYGYFLLLWKFLYGSKTGRAEKIYGALAAITLGLSFYTYFFVFSFISLFSVLLFFWFLATKNYVQSKKIFYVGLGGIFLGIPAFINFTRAIASPYYLEAARRVGSIKQHTFIFSKVWWGTLAAFLLSYRKIENPKLKIFIIFFLFTAFILTNQQLLTGSSIPVPQHYHWYYIAPVAGAVLIFLLLMYLRKFFSWKLMTLFAACLLIIFFWAGFLFQVKSYEFQKAYVITEERYADVLGWLNSNTPKDASVLANRTLQPLLTAYTHDNAYDHGGFNALLVSTDRIMHNFFIQTFLEGVDATGAEDYFRKHRDLMGSLVYGEYWRQTRGCYGCFPDEILGKAVEDYKSFLKKDFISQLRIYQLDYIVWDKEMDPKWGIDRFFTKKTYQKDNIAVYSVL